MTLVFRPDNSQLVPINEQPYSYAHPDDPVAAAAIAAKVWEDASIRNSNDGLRIADGPPQYVVYSSGSTGEPHPITLPLEAIRWQASEAIRIEGVQSDDRVLDLLSPNTAWGFLQLAGTVAVAAQVGVRTRGTSPLDMLRMAEVLRPTVVIGSPTAFRLLLDAGWTSDLKNLRVVYGSEVMPDALLDRLHRLAPTVSAMEIYGSAELGPIMTRAPRSKYRPLSSLKVRLTKDSRLEVMSPGGSNLGQQWLLTMDHFRESLEGNEYEFVGRANNTTRVAGKTVNLDQLQVVAESVSGVDLARAVPVDPPGGLTALGIAIVLEPEADWVQVRRDLSIAFHATDPRPTFIVRATASALGVHGDKVDRRRVVAFIEEEIR